MKIPDLSEIPELKLAEPGEYDLTIKKAMDKKSERTGREGIMFVCEFDGDEPYEALFHSLWLPMEGDVESTANTMLRMLKEFVVAIGIDADDDIETKDFEGVQFSALVDLDTYEGNEKNIIKRVV